MSTERFSLDANVLFYAIDSNDPKRHRVAGEVIERAALEYDCIIAQDGRELGGVWFRDPFTADDAFRAPPRGRPTASA